MKSIATMALAALLLAGAALAEPGAEPPGATVDSLLELARRQNPEYAAMRLEADAAGQRVEPAGAFPDPLFRVELQDVENRAGDGNFNLLPARVGSTKYTIAQAIPFWGKRDLKRAIAESDVDTAQARAQGSWADLAARIKTAHAQLYVVEDNLRLTREILDLLRRLEQLAQVRYAGGLAPQQDAIRAQVEQTGMRNELLAMETERHHLHARLNALLARPTHAPLADPQRLRPLPAAAKLDGAALEDRLRARNPLLFADAARVRAAEKSRELAYRNRYPDFTLGVSPIQMRDRVREWELMVELNIPLQQSSRRAQEREAEATLAAAQARQAATANQLLSDLAESLAAIDAARRGEALATGSLLPLAELGLQSALAGYESGKVDFATLLEAQRAIRQSKQTQLKAQLDAQLRLAEIERLLGEDL